MFGHTGRQRKIVHELLPPLDQSPLSAAAEPNILVSSSVPPLPRLHHAGGGVICNSYQRTNSRWKDMMSRKLSAGTTTTTKVTADAADYSSVGITTSTLCSEPNLSVRLETKTQVPSPSNTSLGYTRIPIIISDKGPPPRHHHIVNSRSAEADIVASATDGKSIKLSGTGCGGDNKDDDDDDVFYSDRPPSSHPTPSSSIASPVAAKSKRPVARLFSLFSVCRDPCLLGGTADQFTLVSQDEPAHRHTARSSEDSEASSAPTRTHAAIEVNSGNFDTPSMQQINRRLTPHTEDIVKLVTSAVLAILEERNLLASQSALKASFQTTANTSSCRIADQTLSPLLFPLPSSPSQAHAKRPRSVSFKSGSNSDGDIIQSGQQEPGTSGMRLDPNLNEVKEGHEDDYGDDSGGDVTTPPLFTSEPVGSLPLVTEHPVGNPSISITRSSPSSAEKAAQIIFRLVTEVSTELSQDDKARIRAKFSRSKSNRSLSIGANPRMSNLRPSHHTRSSSYAKITAWG